MKITAETARLMALAGGVALSRNRADRIAPFVAEALQDAHALAEFDMGEVRPTGPPWGREGWDA